MQQDLGALWGTVPLAERMRPRSFEEFLGQEGLAGPEGVLRRAADTGNLRSLVLWGPPGVGKTALARILARTAGLPFESLSAVTSGVKDIRAVIDRAKERTTFLGERQGRATVLFIDEIHRFNKAQQDALLPFVEDGTLILIGSTTENPSFEVNSALLSRLQVYTLEPLAADVLGVLLERALGDATRGLGRFPVALDADARDFLIRFADGDARALLNGLEAGFLSAAAGWDPGEAAAVILVTAAGLAAALQRRTPRHDKGGEAHYDTISAFIKSLRASDADAACYWLGRMLAGGEDPLFIVRRMVIFASEDVGNADPQALGLAVAAQQAVHFVGLPEATYALYQAASYLATVPKSNATVRAIAAVARLLEAGTTPPVPLHLRNAPTTLMQKLGYGRDYIYPHDVPGHISAQGGLPAGLEGERIYRPSVYGFEREIRKRMDYWERLRKQARETGQP
ncbi:MAG: replication-associated recombination protein A [Planctomycetes bacterium]|nr:replication-associated recombination protein A [Planctomycetota bacterium]